jgi:hypothetical protein
MAAKKTPNVTMRVRMGENELEVSGPSDFVEKKIADFVQLNKVCAVPTPASPIPPAARVPQQTVAGKKTLSPAQFFKKANPRTDVDRVLAAGYYLEVFQQMDNFTAVEVRDAIHKEAKTPPPKNPNDAINKNIKKGYMMGAGDKDGKMAFVLTSDGEESIRALIG